jgi:hypothetical protein
MTKIAGSVSISQRHGSADPDPDPPQNVMDPQYWWKRCEALMLFLLIGVAEGCGASQQLPGPDHPGGILPGLPRPLHCCQELRPGSGQIYQSFFSFF